MTAFSSNTVGVTTVFNTNRAIGFVFVVVVAVAVLGVTWSHVLLLLVDVFVDFYHHQDDATPT